MDLMKTNSPLENLISLEKDARNYGFDWPDEGMILDQAISECEEIRSALACGESSDRIQEEIGDLIHAAISLCVFAGFDPQETVENVTIKFAKRMKLMKELTTARGLNDLKGQNMTFMLQLWDEAKQCEK
jgi:uncharacterized protein YabN with tetrapyrrole methylase and pyrophosphatase domain